MTTLQKVGLFGTLGALGGLVVAGLIHAGLQRSMAGVLLGALYAGCARWGLHSAGVFLMGLVQLARRGAGQTGQESGVERCVQGILHHTVLDPLSVVVGLAVAVGVLLFPGAPAFLAKGALGLFLLLVLLAAAGAAVRFIRRALYGSEEL